MLSKKHITLLRRIVEHDGFTFMLPARGKILDELESITGSVTLGKDQAIRLSIYAFLANEYRTIPNGYNYSLLTH